MAEPALSEVGSAKDNLGSSEVDWDEIVSIDPDGEEDVYDLTVEGLASFVAEDLVVHNSLEHLADPRPSA